MKLFKYGCGCIGFDEFTIIKSCESSDLDGREYFLDARRETHIIDRNLKATPLSDEETQEIAEELRVLLVDGYRYRERGTHTFKTKKAAYSFFFAWLKANDKDATKIVGPWST